MTSGSLHQILKDWDGANFELRKNLLTQFCQLTAGKSAFDMTEELGHRTALLFARFLASLRLRFNKPGVGLLLDAIRQFVGAAGGLEHIDDLVASGAVLTVIEMIGLDTPTESDKVAALRVVHCVAQAGLEYKEVLCKTGAIRIICECLAKSKEDECRDECHVILQCLAAGNPKFVGAIYRALIALLPCDSPSAVHVALQLLRQVQPQVPPIKELAAPLLATMGSYHGEVRYEARLLFVSLVHSEITNYLFQGLMKSLKDNEDWTVVHFIRQACAAQTIHEVLEHVDKDFVIEQLVNRQVVGRLICALANKKFAESQRNASVALYSLAQKLPEQKEVIFECLGPLASEWQQRPSQLQDHIDEIKAAALRQASVKLI